MRGTVEIAQMKRYLMVMGSVIFILVASYIWFEGVARPVSAGLRFEGSTQAVVTEGERVHRYGRYRSIKSSCNIHYEFSVDGVSYEGPGGYTSTVGGQCPEVGSVMDIRYDVDDPAWNVWDLKYNVSWSSALSSLFMLMLTVGGPFYVKQQVEKFRQRQTPSSDVIEHHGQG